jgi:glucosamine-6-phosphate deaminase
MNSRKVGEVEMIIYQVKDYEELSRKAANLISAQVILKPDCVLGLATGNSPIGTYEQLITWYKKGDLDFSKVRAINLDEYKGLARDNSQSYFYYMYHRFYKHINIDMKSTFIPDGSAKNDEEECKRYDGIIEALGGVDLQLLGLGHNGHIGFNEPGPIYEIGTHCVKLSDTTIKANARLFEDEQEVPKYAYTVGMKTIMQAKKVVCIVNGEDKADIVKEAFYGLVTPEVPASILQLHNDVVLIGNEAALSQIPVNNIYSFA